MNILSNFKRFFKSYSDNILLFLVIFLLSLFAFGAGILTQSYLQKTPLEIENVEIGD